ncbi:MAG: hypothetical protein J2P30_25575 [Actinobacteria bacterium]|nr:hypothetical protein [Actinomycetota bacterium]
MVDAAPGLRYASGAGRWVLLATVLGSGAPAAATIRNPARAKGGVAAPQEQLLHCALDAPPQRTVAASS